MTKQITELKPSQSNSLHPSFLMIQSISVKHIVCAAMLEQILTKQFKQKEVLSQDHLIC